MSRSIQSVWIVTREYAGLAGAGGVKDVSRQLAEALAGSGETNVCVIMPRYGFMDPKALGFIEAGVGTQSVVIKETTLPRGFLVDMNYVERERRESVALWQANMNGVQVYLVESERFAEKMGVYTYTAEEAKAQVWRQQGQGHYDYFAMNILLQKASLDTMILLGEHPDIIHCQDGHTATLPAMMRENSGYRQYFHTSAAVVTMHNAGVGYHQEVADLPFAQAITSLPRKVVENSLLAGKFDPFIAAASYAILNTVSENYARELQQSDEDVRTGWLGHALLAKGVTLAGVTNGIDPETFDPTRPEQLHLKAGFDVRKGHFEGKVQCKQDLLERLNNRLGWKGVEQFGSLSFFPGEPLCTFIGRLTAQKGVDTLIESISNILATDATCRFLVFGSGEAIYEEQLKKLARQGYDRVCFLKGFDPLLANAIYAAGDLFLIPSQYEPCGLTDYMAQLLGNVPVVHRVGGLVKVIDEETGFCYDEDKAAALTLTLMRALTMYREEPERFRGIQQAAVRRIDQKHTWQQVMDAYRALYQQALTLIE
ncbi:glycogen/starch synthase [Desulfobulbus rhabdoformis]|uniref:glycogen synthase n=1 Tax=Desulfobulbus rhabdoformis TaxID=34032 RepID=UPI001966A379|nr:glycogen/starch synthase [Desulfobulbus rhabdoformis]MBM9614304.1 glycogen/starch synthase [Desulfobulbus rhabdoformis]